PKEAIRYLERYLEARPDASDAGAVREQIDRLKQKLAPPPEEPKVVPPPPPPVVVVTPPPAPPPAAKPPALWPGVALLVGGAAVLGTGLGLGGAASQAAAQVSDPANSGRYFDA